MPPVEKQNKNIAFTADGFLIDASQWTSSLASEIAASVDVQLTESHWQVIHVVREFYDETGHNLPMRTLVRVVRSRLGLNIGSSIELAKLFGSKTSRYVSMISGLPKPSDCL